MRIVSGMRPTGKLHLGHYLGVIKNWLELQSSEECFFFVADWHALTNRYTDTKDLKDNIKDLVRDWVACGIDPTKSTIFLQSSVKEHAELSLLFGMITPKSWLELNPSYKDLKFNLYFQYVRDFLLGKGIKVDEELLKSTIHEAFYYKKEVDFESIKSKLLDTGLKEESVSDMIQNLTEGEIGKKIDTFGFFGYPVLMASDILVYKAETVPVGEDQLPHVEITREIARKFNRLYNEIFPLPKALLTETSKILGIDGRKMSKSYNNAIYLFDTPEELSKKVLSMKTDPQRVKKSDPGRPEVCNVYTYHTVFSSKETVSSIYEGCKNAQIGCIECKRTMLENLERFLEPVREKRKSISDDDIHRILKSGKDRAQQIAKQTLEEVRNCMNLWQD
ncbi:MAG: tryptophan--tRNA ligase [Hydrogenothermaceae bacterium]|nr:tryptophan--tRNA ligase [Hydrogenothermaceae bacterium]